MAALPSATSQILADRLRTHRIESKKARRKTDFGPIRPLDSNGGDEDIFLTEAHASNFRASLQSPHKTPGSVAPSSRSNETTTERRRQPGVREIDEKLQKLEKLNFDLKMEVYHRREREQKLKQQLRDMHKQLLVAMKMQEEHATLLVLNKELSTELDKSSEAVDQAVLMICDLEAKVEELEQSSLRRSQSTAYSDSGYAGSTIPVATIIPPTPPRKKMERDPDSPGPLRNIAPARGKRALHRNRVPSFMSNPGAENLALREAYGGSAKTLKQAQSFVSMFSQASDGNGEKFQDLPSPRLSVLSESSFPSIYDSKKTAATDDGTLDASDHDRPQMDQWETHGRQDSIKRVSKWMEQERTLSKVEQPSFAGAIFDEVDDHLGVRASALRDSADHQDDSRRPSATSSIEDPTFVGWPDGGSIITGTPSRFRVQRSTTDTTQSEAHDVDIPIQNHTEAGSMGYDPARPVYGRASTSPQVSRQAANGLEVRQDSFTGSCDSPTPRKRVEVVEVTQVSAVRPEPSTRTGTRASLAARTHRFWDRLSIGGAGTREPPATTTPSASTMPPPKPDMRGRRPMPKSATAADVSLLSNGTADSDGCTRPALQQSRSSRRRSVDPTSVGVAADQAARRRSVQADTGVPPDMSRNGAQAAWERERRVAWRGRGNSLSTRDRQKVWG
ncbi:hypothetical protein ANO11243_058710 [Dothideomycetidae sp. 11243]|nr:hypothetical protein ANO11243_058710 [fungal sp. No.11243]